MSSNDKIIAALIVVVLLIGCWVTFFAPCTFFQFSPTREVPARCVEVFKK